MNPQKSDAVNKTSILRGIGLEKIRKLVSIKNVGRGGRKPVFHIGIIVKTGTRESIKKEERSYRNFRRVLKNKSSELFPNTKTVFVSKENALLLITPIQGKNLDSLVLEIIDLARQYGIDSQEVQEREKLITHLSNETFRKLKILHTSVPRIDNKAELDLFIEELIEGLEESLRQIKIGFDMRKIASFPTEARVSLAHRDLGLLNIVSDGETVKFIDPRNHVVSCPDNKEGSQFATPAIDIVAFQIGLERAKYEIRHFYANFCLTAAEQAKEEMRKILKRRETSPFIVSLSKAVIWAGYVACNCHNCTDPKRAFMRDLAISKTLESLEGLKRIID